MTETFISDGFYEFYVRVRISPCAMIEITRPISVFHLSTTELFSNDAEN